MTNSARAENSHPRKGDLYILERERGMTDADIAAKYGVLPHTVRAARSTARRARAAVVNAPAPILYAYDTTRAADDAGAWETVLSKLRFLPRMARVLITSDEHIDDHDLRALELVAQVARAFEPDVIVFNGDTFDFTTLSHFDQDRRSGKGDAFTAVRFPYAAYVDSLAAAAPNAVFVLLDGNHNDRVETFANMAWQLGDTIEAAYADLVRSGGRVLWLNGKEECSIGALLIHHGTRAGKNAAAQALSDLGGAQPVVQGHTHRPAKVVNRVKLPMKARSLIVQSVVSGALCKFPPAYRKRKTDCLNWTHGIVAAHVNLKGDDVHLVDVLMHERDDGSLVCTFGKDVFIARGKA